MTLKEVESLTGLTGKSIHFYEENYLIEVERNKVNGNKVYSEEDVARLRWIKIFRHLDFNIEEIRGMLELDDNEVSNILLEKAESYDNKAQMYEARKNLCIILGDDYLHSNNLMEDYEEIIEVLDSPDVESCRGEKKEKVSVSVMATLIGTLLCIVIIASLFFSIHMKMYNALVSNAVLSIVAAIVLTLIWKDFFSKAKGGKKFLFVFLLICIMSGLALYLDIKK